MNEVEFTHAKEAAKVADILGEASLAGAPRAYKPTAGFAVAVLALFFIGQSAFVINPAMDGLYAQFDSLPISTVSLISTMVSLAMVPSSLMAGALAGKRVSYRTLAVVGAACVAFGGAAAYLVSERFVLLVVSRFFVGFGIGLTMPLGSALIMQAYSGHKSALMNGLAMAINNIAGIFFQISSGVLVMQGVKYCRLLYLAVLVPLVLGMGMSILYPAVIQDFGETTGPANVAFATGLWVALYNGGGFLSTPLIAVVTGVFASSEPRLILGVAGVLMVVISVIWTTGMSRLSRKA